MWSSCVEFWGHQHRKRKKKRELPSVHHRKLPQYFKSMLTLLLVSSIRVANLALHPRLVELWKCEAQHLRKLYSNKKQKQKQCPAISGYVWYCPIFLISWLLMMTSFLLLVTNKYYDMDHLSTWYYSPDDEMFQVAEKKVKLSIDYGSSIDTMQVLCILYLVIVFTSLGMDQSLEHSKLQHGNSGHCFDDFITGCYVRDNATLERHPKINDKYVAPTSEFSQNDNKQFVDCNNRSSQAVMQQLLMQAGDVESNPGPGNTVDKKSQAEATSKFRFTLDDDGNTELHHASQEDNLQKVKALVDAKAPILIRNNRGKTPLDVARGSSKSFLAKFVQKHRSLVDYSKILALAKRKYYGIHHITRVFVIGDPGAGKTSFIESFKREGFFELFRKASESSVPIYAGIIPSVYVGKQCDRVLFYDFAGNAEYYCSSLVESLGYSTSGNIIFIAVVNLKSDYATIETSLLYYISFTQHIKMFQKYSFIIIGSHSDLVSSAVQTEFISLCERHRTSHQVPLAYFTLDCRDPRSSGMSSVKKQTTAWIKESPKYQLSGEASLLLGFLERDFSSDTSFSVQALQRRFNEISVCLPTSTPLLCEIVSELHNAGVLFFVSDNCIILNMPKITKEVHHLLFSQTALENINLQKYCGFGFIEKSVLVEILPPHITIEFLVQFQFCKEIIPSDIGRFASTVAENQSFLFFPALLQISNRDEVHFGSSSIGWATLSTNSHDFFSSKFFHTLLLRLIFSFSIFIFTDVGPLARRHCTIWTHGINWRMEEGVDCKVKLVNQSKGVVVVVKSDHENDLLIKGLSSVVSCVKETQEEFCNSIRPNFFLLDSDSEADYLNEDHLFSMSDVEKVLNGEEKRHVVVSVTGKNILNISKLQKFSYWNSLFPIDLSEVLQVLGHSEVGGVYQFGLELGAPWKIVDSIAADFPSDANQRLTEVIKWWLNNSFLKPPCWFILVSALRKIEFGDLADEVEHSQGALVIKLQKCLLDSKMQSQKPTEQFLYSLSTIIGSQWPSFAKLLSLSSGQISRLKMFSLTQQEATLQMLKIWAMTPDATYGQLCSKLQASNLFPDECSPLSAKELEKQYMDAYRIALERNFPVKVRPVRFNYIGLPRSGKTTFRRRMMEVYENIMKARASGRPDEPSTGVAEDGGQILIKSEMGIIQSKVWSPLKGDEGEANWLIQCLRQKVKDRKVQNKKLWAQQDSVSTSSLEFATPRVASSVAAVHSHSPNPPKQKEEVNVSHSNFPSSYAPTTAAEPAISRGSTNQYSISSTVKGAESCFGLIIKNASKTKNSDIYGSLNDITLLISTDTGGQAEFLDLQASIVQSPSFNLLFSKLTEPYDTSYTTYFTDKEGKETEKKQSTLTVEEVLFQALASIACFNDHDKSVPDDDSKESDLEVFRLLKKSRSKVMFVGTFLDMVKNDTDYLVKRDSYLKEMVSMNTNFYKEIIAYASDANKQLTLHVNNMDGDKSEVKKMQDILEKVIDENFEQIPVPAPWLLLNLLFRHKKIKVMTFKDCHRFIHEQELKMGFTELKNALWFLHYGIGTILYYPELEELEDIVIFDKQVVFDSATNLIINTFETGKVNVQKHDEFWHRGCFTIADVLKATKDHRDERHLPLNKLIYLLEYLCILTPTPVALGDDPEDSDFLKKEVLPADEGFPLQTYFMPCVLRSVEASMLDVSCTPNIAPLMFRFRCGFVPLGLFPSMITYLVANYSEGWKVDRNQEVFYKNRIPFTVFVADSGQKGWITLVMRPQYFEVAVTAVRDISFLGPLCCKVRKDIEMALVELCKLRKYRVRHERAFECPKCTKYSATVKLQQKHFCIVDPSECPQYMECPKLAKKENASHGFHPSLELQDCHKVWFNSALKIDEKPRYSKSEQKEMYRPDRPPPLQSDEYADLKDFGNEVEFILQTVTDNEYQAAVTFMKPPIEGKYTKSVVFLSAGFVVGIFAGHKTALIHTDAGANVRDYVQDALDIFPNSKFVIGVGVGYAFDRSKYKLGDVLVSSKISDLKNLMFDSTDGIVNRGEIICVDKSLHKVFCKDLVIDPEYEVSAPVPPSDKGRTAKVYAGTVASYAAIMSNKTIRDMFRSAVPEVIGGEMEGGELLNFQKKSLIKGVITIKGVGDYGDGIENSEWHFVAAMAALSYTHSKLLYYQDTEK